MRTLRAASINLALVVGSTLFALLALEAALRVWFAFRARTAPVRTERQEWIAPDPDLGYRLHPDSDRFSSAGSQNDLAGKPPDRHRVMILGDSVAFNGDGFRDTIAGRLETLLDGVEVLNASVIGYTNYQELVYLKKYGLQFQPDAVGVIFVLNDLHRFLHVVRTRPGEPFQAGELELSDEAGTGIESWFHQLVRHSTLLTILRNEVDIVRREVDRWENDGFTFNYRADFYTAWQEEPWREIEKQMREMKKLSALHDFRLFVVCIPFGEQYRPDYLARDEEFVRFPQRKLEAICDRLEIPYLDLFDALELESDFREDRIHLTAKGRQKAAEKIAELVEKGR